MFFFYRALLNVCLLLFFLLRENFLHQSILFSWSEKENQCEQYLFHNKPLGENTEIIHHRERLCLRALSLAR